MILQGLNITIAIKRRIQGLDDDVGGSTQTNQAASTICSGIPARLGSNPVPLILRAQGVEVVDTYTCLAQSPNYDDIDVRIDDLVVPESGQYAGLDFLVMSVQDDGTLDSPGNYFRHKSLSLQRIKYARTVQ